MTTSGIGQRRSNARRDGSDAYSQRRTEILTAAAGLFTERGHQGVKIGDIADALGTDRASLYYYFSSRDEIFREIVRASIEPNVSTAESVARSDAPAPQKLRELISALMHSYQTDFPFPYVFIQEDLSRHDDASAWSKEVRALSKRFDDAVIEILEQGMREGSLAADADPRLLANALIGMVNWTHRWYRPTGKYEAQDIADAFIGLALNGLSPR